MLDKLEKELELLQARINYIKNNKTTKAYSVVDVSGTLVTSTKAIAEAMSKQLPEYTCRTSGLSGIEKVFLSNSKYISHTVPWEGYTPSPVMDVMDSDHKYQLELEKITPVKYAQATKATQLVASNLLRTLLGSDLNDPSKFVLSIKDIRNEYSEAIKIITDVANYYSIPVFYINDEESLNQAVLFINNIKEN